MEYYLKQFSIVHFQFSIEESRVQFFAPLIYFKTKNRLDVKAQPILIFNFLL